MSALTQARFEQILDEEGCDTTRILAKIATNNLPCTVCRGEKWTKLNLAMGHHTDECKEWVFANCKCGQLKHTKNCLRSYKHDACLCGGFTSRVCQSCHGTGMEAIDPRLMAQVATDLQGKQLPDLKQIEHRDPDGARRWSGVQVVMVPGQPEPLPKPRTTIPPQINAPEK